MHINISTYALPIMCVFIIFIATFYLVILWIPSTTLPNPPSPSSFTISYSENVELKSKSSPTPITNNLEPLDAYNDAPALMNSTSSSIISTPSWLYSRNFANPFSSFYSSILRISENLVVEVTFISQFVEKFPFRYTRIYL